MDRRNIGLISLCMLAAVVLSAISAKAVTTSGVDVHGFISQGFLYSDEYNYLAHNSTDGSFEYNEFGINFSKNLTDRLRMGMQFFSRDLGDASNNKVTLDWAYGDYRFKDWLGLRVGKIKLPIGIYNETRDYDILRTCIVLPQGIYPDMLRDTAIALSGVGLHGNFELGVVGSLDYMALMGSFSNDNESGLGKYATNAFQDLGLGTLDGEVIFDTGYNGIVRWTTPLSGLKLAYSFLTTEAEYPILFLGATPTSLFADYWFHIASAEFTWNDLIVAAEYLLREQELSLPLVGVKQDVEHESWYVSASYRFTDLFTLGSHYSVTYPDKDDKDNKEKDWALSMRFDLNEYWIFKVEGHLMDGTANVLGIDNPEADWSDDSWYYGAAKVSFSF